jgi:fructokinase
MATSERSWRVLVFGELLWDLLPDGEVLGGAPANLAYRLVSLGVPTLLVSRVGRDARGAAAVDALRRIGVETSGIETDPHYPTGTVQVTFRADGFHDFTIVSDVAYDQIDASGVGSAAAETAECLAFGTLAQRAPTSHRALERLLDRTAARLRVCDVNLRRDGYSEETLRFSLERANVLKLSSEEVPELARLEPGLSLDPMAFCAEALERWNLDTVVVTRGADGAVAANAQGETADVGGLAVEVVDTIGSGDAFTAAFIESLLHRRPLAEACARGNALGALVAATRGGTEPVPAQRIRKLLGRQGRR